MATRQPGQRPRGGTNLLCICQYPARMPLHTGIWPEGTLSPCSQGWRPRGRAWARLEEMGPRPRPGRLSRDC